MATYLFDFDGTLVDSMPTYVSAITNLLDKHNIPYGNEIIKEITPLGLQGSAKYLIEHGVPMSTRQILNSMKRYAVFQYAFKIPAKSNVKSVLTALKKSGADLNVLTASPHFTLDICLKRLGLYKLFNNVWSSDDFKTSKADPQIYIRAAEKLGKSPKDIMFLDDNCNACASAKSAGLTVCGVYDDASADYEDELKKTADYYIRDFSELLEIDNKAR